MTEAQIIRLVRTIIRQEIAHLRMAKISDSADSFRASAQLFEDSDPFQGLRQIRPFGVASRAPDQTDCMLGAIGSDPTHLNILGEFDPNRPPVQKGEAVLYGADGQVVYCKAGGTIHQGTQTAASPVVLGDVLQAQIRHWIGLFLNGQQIGFDSFGEPVFLDPTIRQGLQDNQSEYVDTVDTNIVGQKNFVDRGA